MRVLILTNLFPNPWQPHRAQFNRQQFSALAREHEVRVIAPVAWMDQWRSLHRGRVQRKVLRDGMVVEHPMYLYPPKVLRSYHGQCYFRSVRPTFYRTVEEFAPEVVMAAWAYPDAWAAMKLAGSAGLPWVAKVHGSDVLLQRRPQISQALAGAHAVITVSKQLAAKVAELGVERGRIHVIYNGVDASLFHPAPAREAPGEPLILFIGNLAPVKCLNVLIDACALLRDKGAAFQCRMIGQGPLRAVLQKQIDKLNLGARVQLLGSRPLEELPDWYHNARVLVLPSKSEGVPNVILEALACGTPVVASGVGGIPEVLNEEALVRPNDAPALAAALEHSLSQPRRTEVSFRSWSDSAAQLALVLSQVAERKQRLAEAA